MTGFCDDAACAARVKVWLTAGATRDFTREDVERDVLRDLIDPCPRCVAALAKVLGVPGRYLPAEPTLPDLRIALEEAGRYLP